jgi:predicted O-linked N-acetylglucosamine transferase (SPINDLY family)
MSERLKALADRWKVVAGLGDDIVESLIRVDAPDVLFDLAGHTGPNRLPLFARRIAPAQVTYLGYPDTTGLREMDFRLVDAITDPVGQADAFASERLVRFAPTAWCYSPPVQAPAVSTGPAARGAAVTFGCFNNPSKITDATLRVWARVLARVPGSRLLLKGQGLSVDAIGSVFAGRAREAGIEPARLSLVERTRTLEEHLALYGEVDVALDTFPYNGTTTTCEALWMGVPVISRRGDRHASRVGASLLGAVGQKDWIAEDDEDYVAKAAKAVVGASHRPDARGALREAMAASSLCDKKSQAARFAEAIRMMARERAAS